MAKVSGGSKPEGVSPRKVTDKRGGHIEPEGASPRFAGSRRGAYPKQGFPQPEGASSQGPSGSSQENTQISGVIPPVATRPSGDSKTMSNPLKG